MDCFVMDVRFLFLGKECIGYMEYDSAMLNNKAFVWQTMKNFGRKLKRWTCEKKKKKLKEEKRSW